MSQPRKKERIMKKRTAIVVAVVATAGAIASIAGATGQNRAVPYAPGSEYVFTSSGHKVGTLTGQNLTAQLNTVRGEVSQ